MAMEDSMLSPSFLEEQYADAQPSQTEVRISLMAAASMVEYGGYEAAAGLLPGNHYRKARGEGCYHLRVTDQGAFLHWDQWDPRRSPVRHFLESPALVLPVVAAAVVVMAVRK